MVLLTVRYFYVVQNQKGVAGAMIEALFFILISLRPSEELEPVKHEVDPATRRGLGTAFSVKIAPDIRDFNIGVHTRQG